MVAAGAGTRFGGPKQFVDLGGRRVVDWAIEAAAAASDGVVVVVPPEQRRPSRAPCPAGAPGPSPCRCGLAAVPADAEVIVVHDAARPFAGAELFAAVVAAVRAGADGAVPAVPVADTVKQVDAAGVVVATPPRAPASSPSRRRRGSGPPACAGPTPAAARAPTTPPWSRRPAGGW